MSCDPVSPPFMISKEENEADCDQHGAAFLILPVYDHSCCTPFGSRWCFMVAAEQLTDNALLVSIMQIQNQRISIR